jgi:serine/threonine-protein kinase
MLAGRTDYAAAGSGVIITLARTTEAAISTVRSNNPTGEAGLPKTMFGYDVVERIGEGAASVIYVVSDPKSNQLYALKRVVRETDKHVRFIEQVENEYQVSKSFRHPGLRKSIDLKLNRRLFGPVTEAALIMELVHGQPIDQVHPGDLHAVVDTFMQTGTALAALHHLRLVHCDLKPSNILRDSAGRVKVIDFGQTCPVGTEKQRVQGTPDFIAPEQVRLKPVTVRTDVYNFGATLYWALTGRRVPTLYTVEKSQRHVLKSQGYSSPMELNSAVPDGLSKLVMDCLRIAPAERPDSMAEILMFLERYTNPGAAR